MSVMSYRRELRERNRRGVGREGGRLIKHSSRSQKSRIQIRGDQNMQSLSQSHFCPQCSIFTYRCNNRKLSHKRDVGFSLAGRYFFCCRQIFISAFLFCPFSGRRTEEQLIYMLACEGGQACASRDHAGPVRLQNLVHRNFRSHLTRALRKVSSELGAA